MDDLITNITTKAGIDETTARKAVGIMLHLVKTEGSPPGDVAQLFEQMPGACELAETGRGSGGLMGALGGNTMAAYNKLSQLGLTTDQMKQAGQETLAYASEKSSEELVDSLVKSIPGLINLTV